MKRAVTVGALAAAIVAGGLIWLWIATQPTAAPGANDDGSAAEPWQAVSWSQVEAPFAADGSPAGVIESLVVADGRLVGGGLVRLATDEGPIEMAAAFVSTDGASWRTAIIDAGLAEGETSMLMGIAHGPNGFLAYGSVCCEADVRAAWHSADGLTWRRLTLAGIDPSRDHWMGVTAASGGWLAIVSNGVQQRLLGSLDSTTWSAIDIDGEPISIAAGHGRYVAVGHVRAADDSYDGAVWSSSDGVTWSRVAADDPELVNGDDVDLFNIVTFDGGLLATGVRSPIEDRVQCEEMAMVASLDGHPPVALSCGWGNPMAWHSTDGTSWTAVDPDAIEASNFALARAVPGGPGLVGIGTDGMMRDTTVWVSADGLDWSPLETLRPIAIDTSGGFAVRGRTIVLAGTHWDAISLEPEPVVWVGTVP